MLVIAIEELIDITAFASATIMMVLKLVIYFRYGIYLAIIACSILFDMNYILWLLLLELIPIYLKATDLVQGKEPRKMGKI